MSNPTNLLYAKSHEWVQDMGDGSYRIGLTDYVGRKRLSCGAIDTAQFGLRCLHDTQPRTRSRRPFRGLRAQ